MIKILIVLCLFVLTGCGRGCATVNTDPFLSEGIIYAKEAEDTEVIIFVRFTNNSGYTEKISFVGSDTCKVGQKIKLK